MIHHVHSFTGAALRNVIHRGRRLTQSTGALLDRLCREEQGGEVLEYVFVALLIIVACISVIAAFGTKVLARWTSVNSSL